MLGGGGVLAHRGSYAPVDGVVAVAAPVRVPERLEAGPLLPRRRARARLPDRASREALTVYLDAAALLVAALSALLKPPA